MARKTAARKARRPKKPARSQGEKTSTEFRAVMTRAAKMRQLKRFPREQFIAMAEQFVEERCVGLLRAKGQDYDAGNAFNVFFKTAEAADLPVRKILFVHLDKQLDALRTFVRGQELTVEDLDSRCADIINYVLFLRCLFAAADELEVDRARL